MTDETRRKLFAAAATAAFEGATDEEIAEVVEAGVREADAQLAAREQTRRVTRTVTDLPHAA